MRNVYDNYGDEVSIYVGDDIRDSIPSVYVEVCDTESGNPEPSIAVFDQTRLLRFIDALNFALEELRNG